MAEEVICKACGEVISYTNTGTKEGWLEAEISQICEKCFDNCTFNLEENIDTSIDDFILDLVGDGVVLAGGALRTLVNPYDEIQDYDLFFTKESKVQEVKTNLEQEGFSLIFECPKGELFTYYNKDIGKVQLIVKRIYTDCYDLISSFDITACCAAYDGKQVYKHDRFVFDNLNSLININKLEYPVASMKRIAKYASKGYKLTSTASKYFVEQVNLMQLDESNMALYVD